MDTAVQLLLAVLSPMHRGGSHLAPSAASPVFQMVLGTGAIRALTPHSDSSTSCASWPLICFGDVARRIVGKPVQQVLRTSTSSNAYPPDIARLASLRFTFVVTMTQQSYYKAQKTYNVTSVVTSYGQQVAAPPAPEDGNNGQPGAADADVAIAATLVTEDGLSLQMLENTPPPKVHEDTPPVEKYKCDGSEKIKHSSARKRLILDSDDDEQPSLEEDEAPGSVGGTSPSTTHKSIVPAGTPAAKEKRPRRASSVSQESG